jgi:hypothetical protein
MEEMRDDHNLELEILEARDHLQDLGVDQKIILK